MLEREGYVAELPPLTHDEAVDLMVYHLMMAGVLFQLVPEGDEGRTALRAALNRRFGPDQNGVRAIERKASSFFIASITDSYEALDE